MPGGFKGYYWLNVHDDMIFQTPEERNVISLFKIIGSSNSKVKGILLFNLRSEYYLKLLQNIQISPNGYVILVNNDSHILSKSVSLDNDIGEKGIAFLRNNAGNSGSFNVTGAGGEKMFVVFNTIGLNDWVVAAVVPEKDILREAEKIKVITFMIIAMLSAISVILAFIIASSISSPIRFLSRQVRRFEKGDFNVTFNIQDNDSEIGILAKGLSSLLKTVKNLLQEIREEQMKKRQVELLALQSQINPHFLYNTLGSIRHLIDMDENQDASRMLGALTKYFMIGISKGKEIITIREEVEHVHNYLLIQKMRYSTAFGFEFDIAPEIMDCRIIKLTLQPIVENSIYHGIKNKRGKGMIRVTGERQGEKVVIVIFDNGAGMDEDTLCNIRKSIQASGISESPITYGMKNVNERIRLHFGHDYGIEIDSIKDHYTVVKIRIPFC